MRERKRKGKRKRKRERKIEREGERGRERLTFEGPEQVYSGYKQFTQKEEIKCREI